MFSVGPLIAGMRGCESGHAEVYQLDGSTRSPYYATAEGEGASSTANVTLDANGRSVLCYVNEHVVVKCYDSQSALVTTFTWMCADRSVEVISQSMTGQAYTGGGSAASLPVDLQAVMDRVYTSFGALDWNVDLDGVATKVSTAIATFYGRVFNVKAYGAAGDGTTDDRTAILAAKTAADTYGGAVYFPAGTYKCDSAVTWADTNIIGIPGKSIVTTSNWSFQSADGDLFAVVGMDFSLITVLVSESQGPVDCLFQQCSFLQAATTIALLVSDSTHTVNVYTVDCLFVVGNNQSTYVISDQLLNGVLRLERVRVVATGVIGGGQGLIYATRIVANDVLFDMSGLSAVNTIGDLFLITSSGSGDVLAEMHNVRATSGGTTYAGAVYNFFWNVAVDVTFRENNTYVDPDGNTLPIFASSSLPLLADVAGKKISARSRAGGTYYESGTIAGTDTLPEQLSHEFIWYNKTDTGALTIEVDTNPPPPGSMTVLVVVNASGGTPTLNVANGDVSNASSHSMTIGRKSFFFIYHFATDGILVNAVQDIA